MPKLTSVNVKAYRGLRDITLSSLGDINVLIGPTNAGKSSLLEALCLASGPNFVSYWLTPIAKARGIAGIDSLKALFPNMDWSERISVEVHIDDGEGERIGTLTMGQPTSRLTNAQLSEQMSQFGLRRHEWMQLEVNAAITPDNVKVVRQVPVRLSDMVALEGVMDTGRPFELFNPCLFLTGEITSPDILDSAYSEVYLSNGFENLIGDLAELYPGLSDIRAVKAQDDRWMIYGRFPHGALPLLAMGDGFRAAFIILAYSATRDIVLLDSPEVFQHPKGLTVLSRGLATAVVRRGCQVTLATQSLELLDLLVAECSDKSIKMNVYRFGLKDGKPVAYPPLSLEDVKKARELIGADLRG